MDKLRGSGSIFSTSGKAWKPFRFNPTIAKRNARLGKLKKRGALPTLTKEQMQAECDAAVADNPDKLVRCPTSRRTTRYNP